MKESNTKALISLYSEFSIDDCTEKLKIKVKGFVDLTDFYGKIDENKFWISHHDLDTDYISYSRPKFKGILTKTDAGTLIQGTFGSQLYSKIFDTLIIVWVSVIGSIFIIGSFFDIFWGTSLISGNHKIIPLIIMPLFILAVTFWVKYTRNLIHKDKEAIIRMLKELLNATATEK